MVFETDDINAGFSLQLDDHDAELIKENHLVVCKDPGIGQFSSIKDAVDSITTNSSTNRFLIQVYPGIYAEDTIVCKDFVNISGNALHSVVVEPNNPNNDVFQIPEGPCMIRNMTIRGATGSGAAGLRVTASPTTSVVDGIAILDCREHLVLETTAQSAQLAALTITMISGSSTERFVRVEANSGQLTALRQYISLIRDSDGTLFTEGFLVTGSGARLDLNSAIVNSTVSVGDAIVVEDGGTVKSSAGFVLDGFDRGLIVNNVGAAPNIESSFVTIINSGTLDLLVDHAGTTGFFNGSMSKDKTTINNDPDMSIFYSNNGEKGVISLGPLFLGNTQDTITNVTDLIQIATPTGVLEGGVLSASVNPLDVDISAGFGYLQDNVNNKALRVEWIATTLTLPDDSNSYIFVNNSGVVTSSLSVPDFEANILLGRVRTSGGIISFISKIPLFGEHLATNLDSFLRDALGPIYQSGSLVTENATPHQLDVSSGQYLFSRLHFTPTGGSSVTFSEFFHSAGSFVENTGVTTVDNTQFDDGTNLTALSSGFYTKHTLYVGGDGTEEEYKLVYGQEEFATLVEVEAAGIPTPPTFFTDIITPLAAIIVQEGASNIVEIIDIRPRIGFQAPSLTAVSDHGNLLGLGDDDHLQYLLVNGTRAMSGNLNMGTNDITNVDLVDGVDVSAHASRHSPNGVDPIATDTPVDIGIANSAGTANSVSKSDHVHAHGDQPGGTLHDVATTSVAGFMSSADKTKLDGLNPNRSFVGFGRQGNTGSNTFLNSVGGTSTSGNGYRIPRAATITAVSMSNGNVGNFNIEVVDAANNILVTLSLTGVQAGHSTAFSKAIIAGTELKARNAVTSDSLSSPIVLVELTY